MGLIPITGRVLSHIIATVKPLTLNLFCTHEIRRFYTCEFAEIYFRKQSLSALRPKIRRVAGAVLYALLLSVPGVDRHF